MKDNKISNKWNKILQITRNQIKTSLNYSCF